MRSALMEEVKKRRYRLGEWRQTSKEQVDVAGGKERKAGREQAETPSSCSGWPHPNHHVPSRTVCLCVARGNRRK
jgi:hypothetical protein